MSGPATATPTTTRQVPGSLAAVPLRLRSAPVLGSLLGAGDVTVAVPEAAQAVAVAALAAFTTGGPLLVVAWGKTAGIANNRALHPGAPLPAALAYRFSPDQARPLFFLSLWADARLFGLSPRPFRVTNLALHLLCGLLVYLLLRRLPGSRSPGPALAGTALFLLHPLQSESVIYTWGRSGVLCAVLMLAALLLAPRRQEGAPRHGAAAGRAGEGPSHRLLGWVASLVSLELALAAKEEAVVLPLIALVWWRVAEGRSVRSAARDAGLLAVPVALFLLLRLVLLGAAGRQVYVRSIGDNILGQAIVTLRMIRLAIMPIGQSVDHQADVPSLPIGTCNGFAAIPGYALGFIVEAVRPVHPDRRPGTQVILFVIKRT